MSNMADGYREVYAAYSRGLEPDPSLTVDEWADTYMVIPKSTGSNEHGRYRTSRTPHAREVMRALSDNHPCKRVVVMAASQMLKTQVGLNWLGASIHQSPSNFLWLMPTGKLVKRIGSRIDKTIQAVPQLANRVAGRYSRSASNNADTKEYTGGTLFIATAGAAANLAEVPARRVLFDEIDRAELNVDGEGDPVKLAEARQTTFERNRKSYYPSSPTIEGESAIDALFRRGTQRHALAECVHCGHAQPLEFERLMRSDDGKTAVYPCADCGGLMQEGDKTRMFARGLWSDGVASDGETESFTVSGMFLPYGWFPWIGLLREYDTAKEQLDAGSEEAMIVFYNTRLARCWARNKEQTKATELQARAEKYKLGTVPAGAQVLTAAVDTQHDRLEIEVKGWGEGLEAWVVDYQIILGSPSEASTWARLDEVLSARYRHEFGQMLPISAAFIDSGGAHTQEVYNFTAARQRRNVWAIKGASRPGKPILSAKPSLVDVNKHGVMEKHGAKLWIIGTDTAKDYLASRWKRASGPGAVHFSEDLPEEYYKQVTAEFRVSGFKRGRRVSWWEKKAADRNEALDLSVYNLAAAYLIGLHKRKESQWATLRERLRPIHGDLFSSPMPEPQPPAAMSAQLNVSGTVELSTPANASAVGQLAAPSHAPSPAAPLAKVENGKITLAGLRRGGGR